LRGIRRIGIVVLLCFLVLPAEAAEVVRIYRVQHRTAAELLPLVQSAMAQEGSAEADGASNTLVLAGSSEAVAAALLVLSKVDRPLRAVVVRYESRRLRELDAQGVRVDWSAPLGPVRLGNVGFPAGAGGAGIQGAENADTRQNTLGGEVRIAEGQSARIVTGESVPLTTRVPGGGSGQRSTRSTTFFAAESGFEARARILGDGRIQLELQPIDSQLRAGNRLETSASSTTLVLEPGKTVAVGGLFQNADQRSATFASSAGSGQRGDERILLLTARVE